MELLFEEISGLEKQIYLFHEKSKTLELVREDLEKKIHRLEDENEILRIKLDELEIDLKNAKSSHSLIPELVKLKPEDREILKNKIDELLNKIDYHLRS
ncbi:MAG: hypothetical protein K9I71_00365 [Ignavibacteriales bacterium]|nr:hypothetical protein [Ignavibacteriales bacterium]